ncbi:PspC domain-containing protein [Mycetocola sp. 2940]|uniref:PspC domain-containing protein n=1 Tax=Mycetocola sp. 2940 TaxID=3156452 RepID=UPI00339ABB7E
MNEAPPTPGPTQANAPTASQQGTFFDWIRGAGLIRTDDAWLAGVAGGIARRTGLDPLIVRGIILVVAILGGPALFLYAVAWALLPDSQGRIHLERAIKGIFDPAMIAIGVLVVLTFVPFMQGIWWQGAPDFWNMPEWLESTLRSGWVLALVAGLIWLTVVIARRTPSTAPGQEPRAHADFWTNSATPAEAPTAGSASFGTPTPFTADASSPGPASTSGTDSIWYATPEAAHSGVASPNAWNPAQARSQAERDAQRQARDAARAQQRREHEERYRRRQPGAAFVSISLGLALLAGVFVAVALGYTTFSDTAVLVGVGTALGVIALATILAGIRGKESGALGFFAVVAILVLLFVGVFPRGTAVSVVGNTTWVVEDAAPGTSTGYSMAAGSPTLDLSGLDDRGAEVGGTVELWLGAGTVELVLPEDVPVVLEVAGGIAGLSYTDADGEARERGAPAYREVLRFGDTSGDDMTTVRIWLGAGSVDIADTTRSTR